MDLFSLTIDPFMVLIVLLNNSINFEKREKRGMEETEGHSREQLILETAERLFLEKGSASTSTTEIARDVGCNQALVHYYFRSKEQLFQEIFSQKLELLLQSYDTIAARPIGFKEKLTLFIHTHFELIAENPQLPFFVISEMRAKPERIRFLKERFAKRASRAFKLFDHDMKEAIDRGEIRSMDSLELILTIASLNISVFLLQPLLTELLPIPNKEFGDYARQRRDQNIRTVIESLKPKTEDIDE